MLAPVVLLILMIVADAGRMFFAYLQVSEAARAGAQYGAQSLQTSSDTAGMQNYATAAAPNISVTSTATYYCCCPNSTGTTCTNLVALRTPPTRCPAEWTPLRQSPPCPDWRKYEQVTASGSFSTMVTYPGIPHTMAFTTQSLMRSK